MIFSNVNQISFLCRFPFLILRLTFQNQNRRIALAIICVPLANEFQIIIYQTDFTIGEKHKKINVPQKKKKINERTNEQEEQESLGLRPV